MHKLQLLFAERLSTGLRRTAIKSCSRWAENYRIMGMPFPGPWSFKHHPWIREPHDCNAERMVSQKGAQLAWTECALNKTFYNIDIKGNSVLYILPASTPDARDFSTARFDPALEMSPHINNLFDDVKNIHHKRSGPANLYIRGSRVKSQLKSVPVSVVILDEVDEMVQANIPLARERMSGQLEKQEFMLSTPTVESVGINTYYKASTQDHFFFRCPHCSKWTELTFPECLVITGDSFMDPKIRNSYLICKECKHPLNQDTKVEWLADGKWISAYTDRFVRGFHVSQLYSMTVRPYELAEAYLKGQTNAIDEQEFFNSKLGLPHEVAGARVTDVAIENCQGGYTKVINFPSGNLVTMGVDVGHPKIHYWIDVWYMDRQYHSLDINLLATPKCIAEGFVDHFENLDYLMVDFNVMGCVIDANPEKRKALEFANRFYGRVKLCYYVTGMQNSKQIREHGDGNPSVSVDRTSWMDLALGRFHRNRMMLPMNLSLEAKNHLKAPVRVTSKNKGGEIVAKYVTGDNVHDHLAHSRTYSEIALPLAAKLGQSHNMPGVL